MRPPPTQLTAVANRIIHLVATCTSPSHIRQIQAQLIVHNLYSDTTIGYHFIAACQSSGLLDHADLLYAQLRRPHVFICNALIKAFSHSQFPLKAIAMHAHMQRSCILPNNYTFPFVLKAFSDLRDVQWGQCVHTQIVKMGHLDDIYVQNSLLNLYALGGDMGLFRKVFDEMPQRDVVSWTVVIKGYREFRKFDEALIAFEQMQFSGIRPNQATMVNALSACSASGALETGLWIHDFIRKSGWELDMILGTSLIDMYGKCGRIEEGIAVFQIMKEKNVFTWNSVIKGLALAKSGEEAIRWFSRMEQDGVKPDEVTLTGVLCACSHSGYVQFGRQIFCNLVNGKYGFYPGVKHYACMVDLLARSGCLQEAFKIIKEMPFEATKAVWGALLSGCRAHGDLGLSEVAAWKLIELEPQNSGFYVMLSNLYAQMGRFGEVEKVRSLMKERGLKKDLGFSTVELQPQDHARELQTETVS